MTRRITTLCLGALLFASGCEFVQQSPPLPSAVGARDAFLAVWSAGDYEAMADRLPAGSPWTTERLERLHRRLFAAGAIRRMEIEADGGVDQPDPEDVDDGGGPISVLAGYGITYSSYASARTLQVSGQIELTLPSADAERWEVAWDREHLFPGIEDARSFSVGYRWPRRGAILDRSGIKLAVGRAEARRYPQGSLAGTTIGHIEPYEAEKPEAGSEAGDDEELDGDSAASPEGSDSPGGESDEGSPSPSPEQSEVPGVGPAEDPIWNWHDVEEDEDADEEVPVPSPEPGDLVGGSGLELGLQDRLAGTPTSRLSVVNRRGKELQVVGRKPGQPGADVKTTLDVRIQRAAENAYGGTTGGAVVMDPSNGDLLAIVASSPFDPGNYVGVAGIEPFNRALSGLYPPGSSLKVMTGAAALEEGVVKEGTRLTGPAEYRGVRNFESGAFGTLDFATAVKFSVNTAFAQIAEDLGAKRLTRYAELFGFNRPPAMPLGAATSSFPFPEDEGDIMWSSIGQAQVLATPLQMATIAATIANRGHRMEPRIVKRGHKSAARVVSGRVARTMTGLMENVVKGGTGTGASIAGAQVAGKTGTAEVDVGGQRLNHAWFIAFAPSTSPKVAVAVVSELGGVGGQVAAPLAGRILAAVLPLVR